MLNNSHLWITGGKTPEEMYLSKTELVFGQETNISQAGPELPVSMSGHCMLNLGTSCLASKKNYWGFLKKNICNTIQFLL